MDIKSIDLFSEDREDNFGHGKLVFKCALDFNTIVYNKVKPDYYYGPRPLSTLPLNMDDGKKVTLSGTE